MNVEQAIDRIRPSVLQIRVFVTGFSDEVRRRDGRLFYSIPYGTGFIVNEEGYVITARHVIRDGISYLETVDATEKKLEIGISYENRERAIGNVAIMDIDVIAEDEIHDIALLRLKKNPFSNDSLSGISQEGEKIPVPLGISFLNPNRPRDGLPIGISGYPLKSRVLISNIGYIASSWKIKKTEIVTLGGPEGFRRLQLSDVYLAGVTANPGNSGGPVYQIKDASVLGLCVSGSKTAVVDQFNKPVTIGEQKLHYLSGITYVVPAQHIIKLLEENGVAFTTVAGM